MPVGYFGTVIAINKTAEMNKNDILYDILFDLPFPGGLQLNCSAHRGYKLPGAALINKSYGLRQLEEKTGRPGNDYFCFHFYLLNFVFVPVTALPNNSTIPMQTGSGQMQGQALYMPPRQSSFPQYPSTSNSAFVNNWLSPTQQRSYHAPIRRSQNWNGPNNIPAEAVPRKFVLQPQPVMPLQPSHNLFMPTFDNSNKKPDVDKKGIVN